MTPATIDFHTDDPAAWDLPAGDLLSRIQWRRTDGRPLAKRADDAKAFARYLGRGDALPSCGSSYLKRLTWSDDAESLTGRAATVRALGRLFVSKPRSTKPAKLLAMLLGEFAADTPAEPMELLTLVAILSTQRRRLKSGVRLELFRVCLLASRAYAVAIDQEPPAAEPADRRALRRGELPLLIGHVFEAVRGSTYLRRGGRRTLAETIEDETDTDGTPHARSVDLLP